jgi:hypothetical protein
MRRQASYRLIFRLAKTERVHVGNLVFTSGKPWLFLSNADSMIHPEIQPMIELDPSLLVERYDSPQDRTYFRYQGEVPPAPQES